MNKKYMAVLVLTVTTCSVLRAGLGSWWGKYRNNPEGYSNALKKELQSVTSKVEKKAKEVRDETLVLKNMNQMLTKLASLLKQAASKEYVQETIKKPLDGLVTSATPSLYNKDSASVQNYLTWLAEPEDSSRLLKLQNNFKNMVDRLKNGIKAFKTAVPTKKVFSGNLGSGVKNGVNYFRALIKIIDKVGKATENFLGINVALVKLKKQAAEYKEQYETAEREAEQRAAEIGPAPEVGVTPTVTPDTLPEQADVPAEQAEPEDDPFADGPAQPAPSTKQPDSTDSMDQPFDAYEGDVSGTEEDDEAAQRELEDRQQRVKEARLPDPLPRVERRAAAAEKRLEMRRSRAPISFDPGDADYLTARE